MGEKGKFLVTKEGRFDLGTHMWDDQLFSDILIRDNPIDTVQAMGISRSLREEITRMEFDMKDQLVRQTIMTTQEDVTEIKSDIKRIEEKIDQLK